jgi:uncharacterized membrane protein
MLHRFWEILLGLDKGFLGRDGELHWHFNPQWPGQKFVGAVTWNLLIALAAAALVYQVYRREGRSRRARLLLGAIRLTLLGFVLALLNRPVITLVESVNEPSVLALVVDDTISMQVKDAAASDQPPRARLEAIADLLTGDNAATLRELGKSHVVKFYRFSGNGSGGAAEPIATLDVQSVANKPKEEREKIENQAYPPVIEAIQKLQPVGNSTQVVSTVRSVLEGLQGQRVAGVVVLTDGRDTPPENLVDAVAAVKNYGVKVFPIPVGSDKAPQNIDIRSISVQDSAFKGDVVNVKAIVHGTGYEPEHPVRLTLTDGRTKAPLRDAEGKLVEKTIQLPDDKPQTAELQFKADQVGMLDVTVEAAAQAGEINDKDNRRTAPMEVLDAKINVFYVEGYPRWEYRYIKNEMLREPTINLSCFLQSSDSGFTQEHSSIDPRLNLKYFPYRDFPTSMEQLQECDVILFGDVNVERLSDAQLQMVRTFVEEYSGGFGMIAGPRWSPQAYRNTAIQDVLPVTITNVQPGNPGASITQGFRPLVTKEGEDSSIFRFFGEREQNQQYMKEKSQPIFWYCRGVEPKPGLAEVYAEHPTDTLPDGHRAPLLVVGHFGAGRTLFTGIEESWRWRFYTGESIFDTYWVQQLRYLARSKKIGSRGMTFTSLRDAYEVGEQVRLSLHILNRKLLGQLPDQLGVEIVDGSGQVVRRESLVRQEGQSDTYVAQFPADQIGTFTAKLPPITAEARELQVRVDVNVPAKELEQPQVDRTLLSRLASETGAVLADGGEPKLMELATARRDLMKIPSAARSIPLFSDMPLWDAPLALVIFVLLITVEWVLRKVFGML